MFSFGKIPPRSLDSFGVAGLLGESGKVFYCSLYTTRHIGRVSDLISARLAEEGCDELRLRAVLLFGAFEVFRSQVNSNEETSTHLLAEPLVVECGLDEDKIAVGVSFTVDQDRFPRLDGLSSRLAAHTPDGPFETLLSEIFKNADRVVVRGQVSIRRVELIALLGIPGKMDPAALKERPPAEVIDLDQKKVAQAPKVQAYIELGDLDYPELLKESPPGAGAEPPATGQVLMHGCTELEAAVSVRGAELLEALQVAKFKGGQASTSESDVVRVKGGTQAAQEESVFKVSGGASSQLSEQSTFVVSGSSGVASDSRDDVASAEKSEETQEEEESEEADESDGNRIQDMIAKVKGAWPFRRKEAAPEGEEDEEEDSESITSKKKAKLKQAAGGEENEDEEEGVAGEALQKPSKPGAPVSAETGGSSSDSADNGLDRDIQAGMERAIQKLTNESVELKKELLNPKARRWVDGMVSELTAEKARLAIAAKELNTSIRQKELEFRTREQTLTEELRRRDDMLRQKNNALSRAKDQLSQVTMSAERLKSAKAGAADDAHYKAKFALTQKMLTSAKDENVTLTEKIDELKNQLMTAQMSQTKRNQPSFADFSALQAKYERMVRQAEDLKKTNQQLADKMNDQKKVGAAGSADDSKKKLDIATKLAATHQKESEKLTLKVEEMKKEQLRLQAEFNRLSSELKTAKATKGSKAVTDASSAPAAPGSAESDAPLPKTVPLVAKTPPLATKAKPPKAA